MSSAVTEKLIAQQSPEAQAIIRLLLAEIQELKSQLLKLTPQNSSLPPSSQHPHAKPNTPKSKSPLKRGGQPGHPRHQRVLIPSEECQEVIPLRPRALDPKTDKIETLADDPKPPRDGLVLRMVSRGLPTPGVNEQDTRHTSFYKLDRIWFTREQARSFLPADLKQGAKTQVRGSALNLLVRLNLGTFIQPNPAWNAEDVRSISLNSEVTSVKANIVEVRFSGEAELRADSRYNRNSYTPKLLGHASYDTRTQAFTKFELLAVGTHTVGDAGQGAQAVRGPKSIPLGVLFTINGTNANDLVVPHFHRAYNAIARER